MACTETDRHTHTDCSAWTTKMVSKYFIGLSYLSLRHDPVFSVIITRRTSSRRSNTVPRSSAAGTAICHWKSKTFAIPWSLVVTGSPVRCSSVGDNSHGLCVYGTVCNGLNACQEHSRCERSRRYAHHTRLRYDTSQITNT